MIPGVTNLPDASTILASAGIAVSDPPTAVILPSVHTTTPFSNRRPVPVITVPPRIAVVPLAGGRGVRTGTKDWLTEFLGGLALCAGPQPARTSSNVKVVQRLFTPAVYQHRAPQGEPCRLQGGLRSGVRSVRLAQEQVPETLGQDLQSMTDLVCLQQQLLLGCGTHEQMGHEIAEQRGVFHLVELIRQSPCTHGIRS